MKKISVGLEVVRGRLQDYVMTNNDATLASFCGLLVNYLPNGNVDQNIFASSFDEAVSDCEDSGNQILVDDELIGRSSEFYSHIRESKHLLEEVIFPKKMEGNFVKAVKASSAFLDFFPPIL